MRNRDDSSTNLEKEHLGTETLASLRGGQKFKRMF